MANARGHWEGETLIVVTTNYELWGVLGRGADRLHAIGRHGMPVGVQIDEAGRATSSPFASMVSARTTHRQRVGGPSK